MKIIFLGAPGAGKDTLAERLMEEYNFTMISPGQILRSEYEDETPLGIMAKEKYWGVGLLCPDDLINSMISKKLVSMGGNIIFNGFPRSIDQAKFLETTTQVDAVLYIGVDEDIAVERLLSRGRADDKENIIRQRFKEYKSQTDPLRDYYQRNASEQCKYISINGDKSIDKVYTNAVKKLKL